MKHIYLKVIVFCSFLFSQVDSKIYANVIICQILYDSPYNEVITKYPYGDGEFVELYNTGVEDVSLDGWQLWGGGNTERYSFPDNTIIPAGGYIAVAFHYYYSGGDFHLNDYSSQYSCVDSYQVKEQRVLILSNTGELISLRNAENQIVDSIRYKKQSAASNSDSIPYMDCKSLHRKNICINAGTIVSNTMNDWEVGPVSFGCDIPIENNIINEESYHYSQEVTANRNYRIAVHPLDETTSVNIFNGNVSIADNARAKIMYTYYDGIGREEEHVLRKISPTGKDIVDFVTYNGMGKEFQHWLSAPVNEEGYVPLSTLAPIISTYYQDEMPYSQTIYEASPLTRPVVSTIVGSTYHTHSNTINYQTNNTNEILRFIVTTHGLQRDSYYPPGVLTKTVRTDADGKLYIDYVNIQGQLVMKQIGLTNKTYYVYDEYGRLCYVLPETLASSIGLGITPDDDIYMRQYAYVYHYDSKNNLIYKQLPGCEPILMVYDVAGKLILSQDGNQRGRQGFWSYFTYDWLGRAAYTAEICIPDISHQELISQFKDIIAWETFSTDNIICGIGYSNTYFPTAVTKLFIVNYYDNYEFLQLLSQDTAQILMYQEHNGFGEQYANTQNLLTGQRIYDMIDSVYRVAAMYYDMYGNVIQNRSTARLSAFHHQYAAYNFDGSVKQTLDEWADMTESYQYVYDHAGRLTKTLYGINDNPMIVLSVNVYDQMGNLIAKARHNGNDKEYFSYDIRGQLVSIASGDFTEQLYYADNIPEGNAPFYNGNVSAITISQGGQTLNYRYQYNSQDWLSSSKLYDENSTIDSESFEYDPLGNITHLVRYNNGILIDDLSMQYNGNQIIFAQDNVENSDLYESKEYIVRQNDINMLYDGNGNLISDGDRDILEIKYNHLNLPDTIKFGNGNIIAYQYDALGTKIKTSYFTFLEPILTTIVESPAVQPRYSLLHKTEIWYDNNRQKQRTFGCDSIWRWEKEQVYNTEGYTLSILNDTIVISTGMYYFRKDHIGSNVAVWNASTKETPQRTFYYASGLPMPISMGQNMQMFKYNGKEYEETSGLNEYDSNARHYYPAICRTTTIDPLCEEYHNLSPYSWCGNNFVNAVDPEGEMWYYYPHNYNQEDLRKEYFWVDDEDFYELKKNNPEIRGASAILVFEGARYEFLGWKEGKYGYIDGEGAVTANVTLYGPNGPDDITKGMIGLTMTSDYSTFGAIASDDYLVEWDDIGKRGKLKSNWKLSALDKNGEERWRIPEIDGNLNYSPQARENYGKPYKTGVYLHSTNQNGFASVTEWDDKKGRPRNGVSVGCPLLSPNDFKLLNQKMAGFKNFLIRIIR